MGLQSQVDPTLIGRQLSGVKALEISVQDQPIPPAVLKVTQQDQVVLRDVNSHVYKYPSGPTHATSELLDRGVAVGSNLAATSSGS